MASRKGVSVIIRQTSLYTSPPSAYICLRCQRHVSNTAIKAVESSLARRYASSSSLTNRVRNRIWGTDTPPGPENPYGPPGNFEQAKQENEKQNQERGPLSSESLPPAETAGKAANDLEDMPEESEATTWAGMPFVGWPDWGIAEWDEEHPYQGFMVKPRPKSREELISIIHRALVEVMTLKQADLPLDIDRFATQPSNGYMQTVAEGAKFTTSGDGQVSLIIEQEDLRQAILEYIQPSAPVDEEDSTQEENQSSGELFKEEPEQDTSQAMSLDESLASTTDLKGTEDVNSQQTELSEAAPEEDYVSETPEEPSVFVPVDNNWRQISLADPTFKFAVLKRVMQLTGKRIADPDIDSIKDTTTLFTHLVKKPKPKKLVETLFANEAVDLPNVDILHRRYTPIDKEKEIGRWKVIERELKARGLPVTGKGLVAVGDPIA